MSVARPILPGSIYLLTRRCSQRQFLLRPDELVNQAFLYCLAEAAHRYQIGLIGWLAMSNHYHAVVYDPLGRLPDFACHFHQMLAKCLNVHRSRWENFWSSEPPTYTLLVRPSDVLDKLVYTFLNPIKDHLVESVARWPGASSWSVLCGEVQNVKRPDFYFRPDGGMPEVVPLRTVVPPGFVGSRESWAARVRAAVTKAEWDLRQKRVSDGTRVLGREGVCSMPPFDRPQTPAPRRQLRPLIACRDAASRIAALEALKRFRAAYREARARFVAGVRDVVFPAGTFALRWLCARPSDPLPGIHRARAREDADGSSPVALGDVAGARA